MMLQRQIIQVGKKLPLLSVIILITGTLAGCMGQKYGFPGFGTKQASTAEPETILGEEVLQSQNVNASELKHVAEAGTRNKNAFTGKAYIGDLSQPLIQQSTQRLPSQYLQNEIDVAFLKKPAINSVAHQEEMIQDRQGYKKLVEQIDSGDSSLNALRSSLAELEQSNATSQFVANQTKDSFSQFMEYQKQVKMQLDNSGINESAGVALISQSDSPETSKQESDFSWALAQKNPETKREQTNQISQTKPLIVPGLGHLRGVMEKTQEVIQDHNPLNSPLISETATKLKMKTQSVFTSEQITAEQVLSEITERELQRKTKQLADSEFTTFAQTTNANFSQENNQKPQVTLPVVIDLSKEWVNVAPPSPQEKFNDVEKFGRAIEQANKGAQLPIIVPGVQVFKTKPVQPIEINSANQDVESAKQINNEHLLDVSLTPAHKKQTPSSLPTFQLTAEAAPLPEQETPLEQTSYLPLNLPLDDQQVEQSSGPSLFAANNAPMLIAPEVNSDQLGQPDSDFDEFAADFAGIAASDPSELEAAPLLIDESELTVRSDKPEQYSTRFISLLVCGLAFVSFMLIRWRR